MSDSDVPQPAASSWGFTAGFPVFDDFFGPFLPGRIHLLVGHTELAYRLMDRLGALSAHRGYAVYYIDGAHRIDPFSMARVLRMKRVDPRPVLVRVKVARAFTAYQMDTLIRGSGSGLSPAPDIFIVTAMDSLLSDPEVGREEARKMASNCMDALEKMAGGGCCVVLIARGGGGRVDLLPLISSRCSRWASLRGRPGTGFRMVLQGGAWRDLSSVSPFQCLLDDFIPLASEAV